MFYNIQFLFVIIKDSGQLKLSGKSLNWIKAYDKLCVMPSNNNEISALSVILHDGVGDSDHCNWTRRTKKRQVYQNGLHYIAVIKSKHTTVQKI